MKQGERQGERPGMGQQSRAAAPLEYSQTLNWVRSSGYLGELLG